MKINATYKASALGISIIISLVIALLCGALLMHHHFQKLVVLRYELKERLANNANSGIQYLLSDQSEIPLNGSEIFDLYDLGLDSVKLFRKFWGAYEVIGAHSFCKNNYHSVQAVIGSGPTLPNDRVGFYMADKRKALIVSGKTSLSGKTFVAKEGIKKGSIEGKNYVGDQFNFGKGNLSSRELPPIRQDITGLMEKKLTGVFDVSDSLIYYSSISDSIINNFQNNTLIVKSDSDLTIGQIYANGNVIFYSPTKVFVAPDAVLKNVLVLAPQIEIGIGFHGQAQFFASNSIVINENVILEYPSTVALLSKQSALDEGFGISIFDKCKISGSVIAISNDIEAKQPGITIGDDFYMEGEIYAAGILDLRGAVRGSVWCDKTVVDTKSGYYENHLLNVEIDPTLLSKHFLGSSFFDVKERSILQWL